MKSDYGKFSDQYMHYTSDENPTDLELRLGRTPALAALGSLQGKCVLDFGCGPATNSRRLVKSGARVIGFDADPIVIKKARQQDTQGDYRVYRGLLAKELGGVCIDCILMSFSYCVIPDREVRYILRDMRKILGEGGKLVIIARNDSSIFANIGHAVIHQTICLVSLDTL